MSLYSVGPVNVYLEDGTLIGSITSHEVKLSETKLYMKPAEALEPDRNEHAFLGEEVKMPVYADGTGIPVGSVSKFVLTVDGVVPILEMHKKDETHG